MNNPYASLFGPRRMKPNPSEAEAIRDPLGRGSTLWDQEEEEPDLNGKLESARADWRKDASLNSLFGVNGAFTLEDTVGKNGKNRPGDVFKVQSLLHREGLLDADKTAGPTGFLGIYDHEVIEKFQQENGLKVDGWMGPKGETIQAFQNLYAPVKSQPQEQQPQLPWKDYRPNLFDPKNWALWDKMDARERAFYAQQQEQETQQTETLSGGNAEDDAAPVQLAQQEDALPASDAKETQGGEQPEYTPSASKAWQEKQEADRRFEDAYRMTRKTEGGYSNRKRDKGRKTNFGITERTLAAYHRLYNDPQTPADVKKLQPKHAQHILRQMYYDVNRVGEIADPSLARHIFDMSVNPNPQQTTRWVQRALNEINGSEDLKIDSRMGAATLGSLNRLDESQIKTLNSRLSEMREKFYRDRVEEDPTQAEFLEGWVARARAYR